MRVNCDVFDRLYFYQLLYNSALESDFLVGKDWLYFTAMVRQDGADSYIGKVTLEHLLPGRSYVVHIASKNGHNYTSFSERFVFTTQGDQEEGVAIQDFESSSSGELLEESLLVEESDFSLYSGSGEDYDAILYYNEDNSSDRTFHVPNMTTDVEVASSSTRSIFKTHLLLIVLELLL